MRIAVEIHVSRNLGLIFINFIKRMDIERRRQEAAEYRRKPRLIEDSEIPEGIVKASQHFINEEKEPQKSKIAFEPVGRRQRKEVDYSQVISKLILEIIKNLLEWHLTIFYSRI